MDQTDFIILMREAKSLNVSSIEIPTLDGIFKCNFGNNSNSFTAVSNSIPVTSGYITSVPPAASNLQGETKEVKFEDLVKPPPHLSDDILNNPDKVLYYATPHFDELVAGEKTHEENLRNENAV